MSLIYEHDGDVSGSIPLPEGQKDMYFRTVMSMTDEAVFQYSTDGLHYVDFGGAYPMTAANFRGDMIGIFTYNDSGNGGYVDVDWFDYLIDNKEDR